MDRGWASGTRRRGIVAAVASLALLTTSCSELRGRRRIREGNRLYRDGLYARALQEYSLAERFVPHLHQLWIGKGMTCRHMMTPGAKTAENDNAVDCALDAFDHLRRIERDDPRGEILYLQTLFEADRFETLAGIYAERLRREPNDLASVNGQIQVYSRWNHLNEALAAYQKRADMRPEDAEAQYAVGVYVWQQLYQRGGGPEKASFDPRPDPGAVAAAKAANQRARLKGKKNAKSSSQGRQVETASTKPLPVFAVGDIIGARRIELVELGLRYLERAIALRPSYREAMAYVNLLWRQGAIAHFNAPSAWQACIDTAEKWRAKAEAEYVKGGSASR